MLLPKKKLKTLNEVIIYKDNIIHNIDFLKSLVPSKHFIPVLKSNAYGHGIKEILSLMSIYNFPYVAVDSYYEALFVKKYSTKNALIIGYNLPENLKLFNFDKIAITIYDLANLKELVRINKKVKIHLKINSGMNRQGIKIEELDEYIEIIKSSKKVELEGIFSHLADSDSVNNEYTDFQKNYFLSCVNKIKASGLNPKYVHLSATHGLVKIKEEEINTVRVGIGIYGYHTYSKKDENYFLYEENLKPALEVKSTVINLIKLKKGDKVSYNGTFEAPEDMTIGVVPFGYYEGLDRGLSNKGFLEYDFHLLPIVGRICMNLTCFDTKGLDIKVGDNINIISNDNRLANSINKIAHTTDTISYEVLVRINESIRRKIK